jgi:hypothetical protein
VKITGGGLAMRLLAGTGAASTIVVDFWIKSPLLHDPVRRNSILERQTANAGVGLSEELLRAGADVSLMIGQGSVPR